LCLLVVSLFTLHIVPLFVSFICWLVLFQEFTDFFHDPAAVVCKELGVHRFNGLAGAIVLLIEAEIGLVITCAVILEIRFFLEQLE